MLRMGEKNSHNRKQLWEDGIKLEPWILKRMEQDLREILLRSSKFENDGEKHHHELLRHSRRIKRGKVEPKMKRIWKRPLEKACDWWKFILTSNLEMNLRIAPGKLEESGKILGKDLWVRAHSKENTVGRDYLKERLHRIKWLEWDNNLQIAWTDLEWKDEPSEISSALQNKSIARSEWLIGAPV